MDEVNLEFAIFDGSGRHQVYGIDMTETLIDGKNVFEKIQ